GPHVAEEHRTVRSRHGPRQNEYPNVVECEHDEGGATIRMRVDVGGHFLHCSLVGSGEEVVTLAHGLATDADTWAGQVAALASDYRVLTWDMRGHGRSDSPPGPWSLDDLSRDLARLLDAL